MATAAILDPMSALIRGTVEHLRATAGLGLDASSCDEQAEGKPPPDSGQEYVAVHDDGSAFESTEFLDGLFALNVTITFRSPWTPRDRENETIRPGIRRRAWEVALAIHGQKEPAVYANAHMAGLTDNGFVEPLRLLSISAIETRGPDWFWAEGDEDGGDPQVGISITVRFNRARVVQGIDDS